MYEEDLVLNDLERLTCHKPKLTKSYVSDIYE